MVRLLGADNRYNAGSMLDCSGGRASGYSLPALPATFLALREFADWRDRYDDIAVLDGTRWMFDAR